MTEFAAEDDIDIRAAVGVADGSLTGDERAGAQARLQASATGRRALEQQERVVRALRAGGPVAPPGLRAAIHTQHLPPPHTRLRSFVWPVVAVGACVTLLALVLAGGPGHQPTVAAALELGRRPATAPAPRPLVARPTLLAR